MSNSDSTKRGPRSTFKHVAAGAHAHVELPKKIFVLVTSGYLLQYAETGPSDRLPEKMLHLGKDSAAFACDLLPGKHYVLQVSQAVDQAGVVIANSGSIFSKLGLRSAAARRMTPCFLLVMPSGPDMESWMAAIRQEIEHLGGKKIDPDPVRPKTGDAAQKMAELKKSPSHRYQVKRDPGMVEHLSTPHESPQESTTPSGSPPHSPKIQPAEPVKPDDKEDAATIDGIDMEASKLDDTEIPSPARKRANSDAPSRRSSHSVSVEQHQLNGIRSSMSTSTRASQAGTAASTIATSQTSSVTGSPPRDAPINTALEANKEYAAFLKSSYRPAARHSSSIRRSVIPPPRPKDAETREPAKKSETVKWTDHLDSPVTGRTPSFSLTSSPQKNLMSAQSEPNLKAVSSVKEKHDSKVPSPPTLPPPAPPADGERPESFVGDLPPPSTWSSSRGPGRRTSVIQSTEKQAQSSPPAAQARSPDPRANKRMSFSMPLKVNPSGPHAVPNSGNNRRASKLHDPDTAGESPVVHTLTAIAEPSKRMSISQSLAAAQSPTSPGLPRSPPIAPSPRFSLLPAQYQSRTPSPNPTNSPPTGTMSSSPRLSLLPNTSLTPPSDASHTTSSPPARAMSTSPRLSLLPNISSPPAGVINPPKRSSSANAQQASQAQPLRRPTSLQVRSDHAPFLSSVRNSSGQVEARAVPIRGMKPSRSASNVAALASSPLLSTENPSASQRVASPSPALLEEADQAMPLPSRAVSPMPPRPASRSGTRRGVKTRSSLPELDLGIPVVGLGPPAPPPSAPLPLPPPASRASSPTPEVRAPLGIDAVAGLGIRVS